MVVGVPPHTVDLTQTREQLHRHLLDHIMPFWTTYAVDWDRGGVYTFLSDEGTVLSHSKSIISNARALWTFSALVNRVEERREWRDVAHGIYSFLQRCGRDADGLWVYMVDETEDVTIGENSIIADAFAIHGLSEYFRMSGDSAALSLARETANISKDRLSRPGSYKTAPYPTPAGTIAHREFMQFSRALCELGDACYDPRLIRDGLELGHGVLRKFWQPARGVLLEYVDQNGKPVDSPAGRTMVPGHALESLWFQIENFTKFAPHDPKDSEWATAEAARAMKPCIEKGWDHEHGGILLAVDVEGREQVYWNYADMKRWWPATEAMPALLLAFEQLGEPWCIEWFKRVHDWAFTHFPAWEQGEWFQNLNRDGTPIRSQKEQHSDSPRTQQPGADDWRRHDLAVKDPFHLPRGLIVSCETLRRLDS